LARAQHFNYKFDEALANIDVFTKRKDITDVQKKEASLLKDFCLSGKSLTLKPTDAKITNLGKDINTEADEFGPIVNSDETIMMFTYSGPNSTGGRLNEQNRPDKGGDFHEDVFITHKENGKWITPKSAGENVNTNMKEAAVALSRDGQKLLLYRDDGQDAGDIYMSTLSGETWSFPEKLKGDVNSFYWEGSASLSPDEKTLYFASERPGGSGGKDLYRATLQEDGTWREVKNLGPEINTFYDEDCPFIHADGKTLFFNTYGYNSMGYNDIFMTKYNRVDSSWSKPENLGSPINTPDDDKYFVLNAEGSRGYYASGRSGGVGLQDVYMVTMPSNFLRPIAVTVKGHIVNNGKPAEASVVIDVLGKNRRFGTFNSNSVTGNYLVNIEPGYSYKITYKFAGMPEKVQLVDASKVDSYLEKVIDIDFSSKKDDGASAAAIAAAAAAAAAKTGNEKGANGGANAGGNNPGANSAAGNNAAGNNTAGNNGGANNAGGNNPQAGTFNTSQQAGGVNNAGGNNPQAGGANNAGGNNPQAGGANNAGGNNPQAGTFNTSQQAGGNNPQAGGATNAGGNNPQAGGANNAGGNNPQAGGATNAGGNNPQAGTFNTSQQAGGNNPQAGGATNAGGNNPQAGGANNAGQKGGNATAGGNNNAGANNPQAGGANNAGQKGGNATAGVNNSNGGNQNGNAKNPATSKAEQQAAFENSASSVMGNKVIDGLSYKVQIGSLTDPKKFNYSLMKGLGKVDKNKLDDGITRLTVGNVKTLNDAFALKKKVRDAGVSDAFITAVYKGKRLYLTDLQKMGLIELKK
jgi:hypothetical protein